MRDENGLEVSQVQEKSSKFLLYLAYLFTFPYPLHSVQIDTEASIHAERTKKRQRHSIPNGRHQVL